MPTPADSRKGDSKSETKLQDAISWSSKNSAARPGHMEVEHDPEAKKRYDENYERIFGKRDIPHGTDD